MKNHQMIALQRQKADMVKRITIATKADGLGVPCEKVIKINKRSRGERLAFAEKRKADIDREERRLERLEEERQERLTRDVEDALGDVPFPWHPL